MTVHRNPSGFRQVSSHCYLTEQPGEEYLANKKSWVTGEIITTWVKQLDKKMKIKNREISLVIDNCPAHLKIPGLQSIARSCHQTRHPKPSLWTRALSKTLKFTTGREFCCVTFLPSTGKTPRKFPSWMSFTC